MRSQAKRKREWGKKRKNGYKKREWRLWIKQCLASVRSSALANVRACLLMRLSMSSHGICHLHLDSLGGPFPNHHSGHEFVLLNKLHFFVFFCFFSFLFLSMIEPAFLGTDKGYHAY